MTGAGLSERRKVPRKIKTGNLVRSSYKAGWYGKVFEVEKRKGSGDLVTVLTICTADGRPHRKVMRKRLDEAWLEVVEAPPERFKGRIPDRMPDGLGQKGGTPRKKFPDYVKGSRVGVIRYEHGWEPGEGTVTCFGDHWCHVQLDDTGAEITVYHVRDLTIYR